MKKIIALLLIFTLLNSYSSVCFSEPNDSKNNNISNCYEPTDFSDPKSWKANENFLEDTLLNGTILNIEDMGSYLKRNGKSSDFSSKVYKVDLDGGIEAVFKVSDSYQSSLAEIAAYRISKELDFFYVPPTVSRNILIDGEIKTGTLQLFISTDIDLCAIEDEDEFIEYLKNNTNRIDLENFKIYNFVFGQWDVGGPNLFIKNGMPISFDNEHILDLSYFPSYGEMPVVLRKEIPKNNWKLIKVNWEYKTMWFQTRDFSTREFCTYCDYIPACTKKIFEKINIDNLKRWFDYDLHNNNQDFQGWLDKIFKSILDRIDMLKLNKLDH
ncbi:MAG: hypothetical protein RUMPE_00145 [Eubacteriales bacterium SKADARSKE-1]|nr:hypothetical protein [Eubacteriales bacterium SKADARSKE-1]